MTTTPMSLRESLQANGIEFTDTDDGLESGDVLFVERGEGFTAYHTWDGSMTALAPTSQESVLWAWEKLAL